MKYIYVIFEKNLNNYGTTKIGNTRGNGINIYYIYKEKNQVLATFLARAFDIVFSDSYIYNDLHINPFSY